MTVSKTVAATLGALAVGAASLSVPAGALAAAPPSYGSTASAVAVAISVAGKTAASSQVGTSAGAGAPAYLDRHIILNDDHTIQLPVALGQMPLALVVNVPAGRTRAEGHRVPGGAGYSAVGFTVVRTAKVALISPGVVPVNLLQIKATRLTTEADALTTLAGKQTNMTSASAGAVMISGALLGGQVINLSGSLKPRTVFSSPTITIKTATFTKTTSPTGQVEVTVRGIDVVLRRAQLLGSIVTGHLILATSSAY